jgi:hypothetical protein
MKPKDYLPISQKHYLLIGIALISSLVSIGINIYFFIEHSNLSFEKADFYMEILIAIAAAIVGLSILSIYSIFNANIDEQKAIINTEINDLKNLSVTTDNMLKEIGKIDKNILYLFVLTSDHTPNYYKASATQHFIDLLKKDENSINNNMKDTIVQYYGSLTDKEKTKSYFPELEELIGYCKNKG